MKKISCPQCGKDALWSAENPYRPFCCERCRLIDLGAWASESYQIPQAHDAELYDDFSTGLDDAEKAFTPTRH